MVSTVTSLGGATKVPAAMDTDIRHSRPGCVLRHRDRACSTARDQVRCRSGCPRTIGGYGTRQPTGRGLPLASAPGRDLHPRSVAGPPAAGCGCSRPAGRWRAGGCAPERRRRGPRCRAGECRRPGTGGVGDDVGHGRLRRGGGQGIGGRDVRRDVQGVVADAGGLAHSHQHLLECGCRAGVLVAAPRPVAGRGCAGCLRPRCATAW